MIGFSDPALPWKEPFGGLEACGQRVVRALDLLESTNPGGWHKKKEELVPSLQSLLERETGAELARHGPTVMDVASWADAHYSQFMGVEGETIRRDPMYLLDETWAWLRDLCIRWERRHVSGRYEYRLRPSGTTL